ncbi:MAG: hypothetical protein ACYC21_05290 [Eubacteriales bacterium]
MNKKVPSEEYRQTKINECKSKVTETVDSFKGALNSVLDEAVSPIHEKIDGTYKNAVSVGDFAKAEILIQKLIAELIEELDKNLKRLIS